MAAPTCGIQRIDEEGHRSLMTIKNLIFMGHSTSGRALGNINAIYLILGLNLALAVLALWTFFKYPFQ